MSEELGGDRTALEYIRARSHPFLAVLFHSVLLYHQRHQMGLKQPLPAEEKLICLPLQGQIAKRSRDHTCALGGWSQDSSVNLFVSTFQVAGNQKATVAACDLEQVDAT